MKGKLLRLTTETEAGSRFISPDPKYLNPDRLSGDDLTGFLRLPGKGNLYAYALNNPVRYADPTGLDDMDKVGKGVDSVGLVNSIFEAADRFENSSVVKWTGRATTGFSVGVKAYNFAKDPSADTGGQLWYEGTKTGLSIAAAPAGALLTALDLLDVGPSASLQAIEKTIKNNREAETAYKEATKHAKKATELRKEAIAISQRKLDKRRSEAPKVEKWSKDELAKMKQDDRRTQAEIKRLERSIRHYKRLEKGYKRLEKKILEQ